MDPLIHDIKSKKRSVFVVSPHLDDAILSSGELIATLSYHTQVTVITLFTAISTPPYTLSAKKFVSSSGYKDAESLYADRRIEDRSTIGTLGAKTVHLGFVDALWRKKEAISPLGALSKPLAELTHRYPVYRVHITGKMHPEDKGLQKQIEDKIVQLIPRDGNSLVFAPLGVGGHIDHRITRDVCASVFTDVIYYSDFPYNLTHEHPKDFLKGKRLEKHEYTGDKKKKEALIKGYKTQLKALFPSGSVPTSTEEYFVPPVLK